MLKCCLVTAIVSVFFLFSIQVGSNTTTKYVAKANAVVRTVSPSPEATCSCGFDCSANSCTFSCTGDFFGCISCVSGCCSAAKQAEGCDLQ